LSVTTALSAAKYLQPQSAGLIFHCKVKKSEKTPKGRPLLSRVRIQVFRIARLLMVFSLTVLAGCSQSETMIGRSGPLSAFRRQAFLGWEIRIKNASDAEYPALYAINGWTDLRHVPAHGSVKAGYVLGREIPSFFFARPPLKR
jgi:hypothetical protein